MSGLREAVVKANDRKIEAVATPEWDGIDGKLFVRTITVTEHDAFIENLPSGGVESQGLRARFVAFCTCDKVGKRVFTDADVDMIGGKAASAIDRLFTAARLLNKLDVEEDTGKNSSETSADASPSD